MDARELFARCREHPQRVGVSQIVFARERKPSQVLELADVIRLDVRESLAIQGDARLHVRDERTKPLELQRPKLLPRHRLELGLEDHLRSIPRRMR